MAARSVQLIGKQESLTGIDKSLASNYMYIEAVASGEESPWVCLMLHRK